MRRKVAIKCHANCPPLYSALYTALETESRWTSAGMSHHLPGIEVTAMQQERMTIHPLPEMQAQKGLYKYMGRELVDSSH